MHSGAPGLIDDDVNARATTGQRIARVLISHRRCDVYSPERGNGLGEGLTSHTPQLPGDDALLPLALRGGPQVREFTAANAARTSLWPHRLDAISRSGNNLHCIGPREILLDRGDACADDLARGCVPHEHDAATGIASDARTSMSGFTDAQLEDLADARTHTREIGTTALRRAAARRTGTHEVSSATAGPRRSAGSTARADGSVKEGTPTRRNGSLTR